MLAPRHWWARLFCALIILSYAVPALASDPLPSWQGPVKADILNYVHGATTPGGPGFVPPEARKAAFDVDGTLISEKPLFLAMEVTLARLAQVCPRADHDPSLDALCAAAATRDRDALTKDIDAALSVPFFGWSFARYQALCAEVYAHGVNPAKDLPHCRMIYQPMLELLRYLEANGFEVWLCSGSPQFLLRAIAPQYLGVPAERCLGTWYEPLPARRGQALDFTRGNVDGDPNLRLAKARILLQHLGAPPVLVFGNSRGDLEMIAYCAASPWPSRRYLLVHDDPREFVYAAEKGPKMAQAAGAVAVSMRESFVTVFVGP